MKFNGSAGATALVGMAGFVGLSSVDVDGELHISVETTAARVACASCGVMAKGHGRRRVKVRDLAMGGRPTVLCWAKRIWRCADSDCEVATWSETSDHVEASGTLTVRAEAVIYEGALLVKSAGQFYRPAPLRPAGSWGAGGVAPSISRLRHRPGEAGS